MKTAQDIYEEYKIIPSLQLHQLRVAVVAKLICDNFKQPVDTRNIILACLFHDMGNILKFDLGKFPEFLEPQGLEYWQEVKEEFRREYGEDQHEASVRIARELGLPEFAVTCIAAVAFSKAETTLQHGSWEEKICEYADTRVGPHGILPLSERLEEGRKRYEDRAVNSGVTESRERFDALVKVVREIERQIAELSAIPLTDISDERVAPIVAELRKHPVP